MENTEKYLHDITEIRRVVSASGRFLSLSGLSGILGGVWSLAGAWSVHRILCMGVVGSEAVTAIAAIAAAVLALSLITGLVLTVRRARQMGASLWTHSFRQLCIQAAPPLLAGGLYIIIAVMREQYASVAALCLLFYGLALLSGARFSHKELYYAGTAEVLLGLVAALFPAAGLPLWAAGFGIVHLIYGIVMYFRYERA
ncbi:MAG: hypothetical protein LBR06_02275 [Bacteroidales bacterium]|jgi:hypothetical protein|nr:hypothetical protein [Bacteroidales bacterium]